MRVIHRICKGMIKEHQKKKWLERGGFSLLCLFVTTQGL